MAVYSIKDLERLTHLKAHTIRIWEQRYNLFSPERTETNIRIYSDADLRKILNVSILLESGMKISNIGKLNKTQLISAVEAVIENKKNGQTAINIWIDQCIAAIVSYDEIAFDAIFKEAIKALGIEATYQKVIVPLLVSSGLLWSSEKMIPAQEHFLSNLIRQKIFAAIDQLPKSSSTKQKWVLFLNEEEAHEIGLLYAYYLIKFNGFQAIYLGSSVPFDDLLSVIETCKPTHIGTFFVRNQPERFYHNYLKQLTASFPDTKICVSGNSKIIENFERQSLLYTINQIEDLENILTS